MGDMAYLNARTAHFKLLKGQTAPLWARWRVHRPLPLRNFGGPQMGVPAPHAVAAASERCEADARPAVGSLRTANDDA